MNNDAYKLKYKVKYKAKYQDMTGGATSTFTEDYGISHDISQLGVPKGWRKVKSRKAFKIVALLSLDDMVNYARILGKYAKDLSNNQVEALLYDICESKPKNIIEISEDPDLKFKVFLNKLIDKNIVSIVNGKYMNGNEVIGINQDYAIQWVRNSENSVVVNQWASTLSFDGIGRSPVKKTAPKETKKQAQRKTTSKT